MTLAPPAPRTPALLLPGADFGCIKAAAKQTPWVLASPGVSLPDPLGSLQVQRTTLQSPKDPSSEHRAVQAWINAPIPCAQRGTGARFAPTTARDREREGGKPSAEPSGNLLGTPDPVFPHYF